MSLELDPESTRDFSEYELRLLQLAEVRRMLGMKANATHEDVIVKLYQRPRMPCEPAPILPRRYKRREKG